MARKPTERAADAQPEPPAAEEQTTRGAAPPVELNLNTVIPLQTFRSAQSGLTLPEMQLAVEQALMLFDDLYAHLLLKQAMYAVDPVQALRLMLLRVRRGQVQNEGVFHRRMLEIFNSVRDLHTNYLLPEPFATATAFLPFMIDEYFDEQGIPHYPVTRVMEPAVQAPFTPGVEITHWNGMPMATAIDVNARDHAGSNDAANHLQGLLSMTSRPLLSSLSPREDWVTLTFQHARGVSEIRFPWSVFRPEPPPLRVATGDANSFAATAMGIDVALAATHRARQILYKPESVQRERKMTNAGQQPAGATQHALGNATTFPNNLEYSVRETGSGSFGLLRIRSFDVPDHLAFLQEVIRILGLLPQEGLIIDVRGNPGGNILAGEHLLQLFTDRRIEPEPVCLRNTLATLTLTRNQFLQIWRPSIDLAVETSAQYSQYFPISDPNSVNATGRRYQGKVVLLIDSACYSTTDFFSAGFQDHEIGPVLGFNDRTGAGGANVWTHELLSNFVPARGAGGGLPMPLQPLPRGMAMRVAFRRSSRVGARAGLPLEDLGVKADIMHQRTMRDVFADADDLYEQAGEVLWRQIKGV